MKKLKKYCNFIIETKDLALILNPIEEFDKQQLII